MGHAAISPQPVRALIGLAALALLSSCFGPGNYSWYCDQLNTSPSTWKVVLTSSGICAGVPKLSELVFDSANPTQFCGPSCSCTLSAWSYAVVGAQELRDGEKRLNPPSAESCQATIQCTVSGTTVFNGSLAIPDWSNSSNISLGGVMSDGAQCQITVAGAPQ